MSGFETEEFLGFFCDDARAFVEELAAGLSRLSRGWDGTAFESCTRATHSLSGIARQLGFSGVAYMSASLEAVLGIGLTEASNRGATTVFTLAERLHALLAERIRSICAKDGEDEEAALTKWTGILAAELPAALDLVARPAAPREPKAASAMDTAAHAAPPPEPVSARHEAPASPADPDSAKEAEAAREPSAEEALVPSAPLERPFDPDDTAPVVGKPETEPAAPPAAPASARSTPKLTLSGVFSPPRSGFFGPPRSGMWSVPATPSRPTLARALEEIRPYLERADRELLGFFREELETQEAQLSAWRKQVPALQPGDPKWPAIKRFLHTLSGSAATAGIDPLAQRAKLAESHLGERSGVELLLVPDLGTEIAAILEIALALANEASPGATAATAESPAAPIPSEPTSLAATAPSQATAAGLAVTPSADVDDETLDDFREEGQDLLERLEERALALGRVRLVEPAEGASGPPGDSEGDATLREIFRVVHTLKGIAQTAGQGLLGEATHRLESFLEDETRSRALPGDVLSSKILRAFDVISALFDGRPVAPTWRSDLDRLLLEPGLSPAHDEIQVERATQVDRGADRETSPTSAASPAPALASTSALARARPSGAIPDRARTLDREEARGDADAPAEGAGDFEESVLRVPGRRLAELMNLVGELVINRTRTNLQIASLGELRSSLRTNQERLVRLVESYRRRYEFQGARAKGVTSSDAGSASLSPSERTGRAEKVSLDFSGLEFDRYDDLNILSRSLMEVAADTTEIIDELKRVFGTFSEQTESSQKITNRLQEEITRIRMVPIARLFRRLERPLRHMARSEGKEIALVVSGQHTEMDRAVLDRLHGPLVHLVRNAAAHGIETPALRRERGKSPIGRVEVGAVPHGDTVTLYVKDDGGGIDVASLAAAAERRGLRLPPGADLTQLIFVAGLSSRASAGDLAGRGIGMSAVKESVARLNGRLDVTSHPGVGTEFSITVPVTLAIHQALMVKAGGEPYAIPLSNVERVIGVTPQEIQTTPHGRLVVYRDEVLAFHSLSELVASPSNGNDGAPDVAGARAERPGVVVRAGERRAVLLVDESLAREEIVLKSLGRLLQRHPIFSGASIAGDGSVVPVLDIGGLLAEPSQEARGGLPVDVDFDVDGKREARVEPLAGLPDVLSAAASRPKAATVLIVDDSLSIRRAAQHFLKESGLNVLLASDGVEALEVLRRQHVDLVVTDLEMPRLNGYELIATVRRNHELDHMPIVILSSRGSEKHRRYGEELGANGYMTKPFTRDDLLRWLPTQGHALAPAPGAS